MSASIYYRQVKPVSGKLLNTSAPSSFIDSLEKAFGGREPTLTTTEIPILQGMAILWTGMGGKNPYEQLIEGIQKYGEIEIDVQY